jgi:WD40 repeat protein
MVIPGGHTGLLWRVAASPDGRWVATASGDGTVNLWDGRSLKLVRTLQASRGMVWTVAFSADSRYLASGSGDVRVWEAATGREVHKPFEGHRGLVNALAFHPQRPWLASSGKDGSVRLWDLEAGKPLGVLHQAREVFECVAFSPDGRWLAAGGYDTRVALWDFRELPPRPSPPTRSLTNHDSGVWAVAFSPDGKYFASGAGRGVIILWDGARFEPIVTLRGDTGEIRGLSFSKDGRLLAGSAYIAPMIVWDLPALRRSLAARGLDW